LGIFDTAGQSNEIEAGFQDGLRMTIPYNSASRPAPSDSLPVPLSYQLIERRLEGALVNLLGGGFADGLECFPRRVSWVSLPVLSDGLAQIELTAFCHVFPRAGRSLNVVETLACADRLHQASATENQP
jgi:hypothetical protein